MTELTAAQERAVQLHVLQGKNKSDAYREAGFKVENATPKSVNELASRMFAEVKVAARVEELKTLQLKSMQVTHERIVAEYAKIAFLDTKKLFTDDGAIKPISELDDDTAAALVSFEVAEEKSFDGRPAGLIKKVKLADKKGALDSLAKIHSMLVERHEHTGKNGEAIETKSLSDIETARQIAFLLNSAKHSQDNK